jgi:hypothetical protein
VLSLGLLNEMQADAPGLGRRTHARTLGAKNGTRALLALASGLEQRWRSRMGIEYEVVANIVLPIITLLAGFLGLLLMLRL